MKVLAFFFSLLALILSFLAYKNTRQFDHLLAIAQAISDTRTKAETAKETVKEKTAGARERLAKVLEDLAEEIRK